MAIQCKECKKVFHYCGSCETDKFCEKGFCCKNCMIESDQYKSAMENVAKLYTSFFPKQRIMFTKLMEDYIIFEDEIDSLIYQEDTLIHEKGNKS